PGTVTRWLDVGIAAVIAGVIGARALHVALEWSYFTDHRNEIRHLELGGLAWHGALLAGIPAALIMARLRRVDMRAWSDAAALVWPVGLMAAWRGCRGAGCGYGYEVKTLADWPDWLVEELPDVYGFIAPRLDLAAGGILFGGALLILAVLLTWRGWLPGLRFWVILGIGSLGLALFGFFRADPAHLWLDHRTDQVLDLITLLLCTLTGSALWLWDRRARPNTLTF
ncbi:MAG: prolipoprotein diacylglyceryl transferase, partial [Anaerolineae bacterium]|nr:prolipoprotein diacylglyceryl transferase [Anaerolineae bacterium]